MLYSKIINKFLEDIYLEVCRIYHIKYKEYDTYSFFSNIRIFFWNYSTLSEKYLYTTLVQQYMIIFNESSSTYYVIVYYI